LSGKFLRSVVARQSNELPNARASPPLTAARIRDVANNNHHEGERILRKSITAIAAAAFLATGAFAATPALAAKAKPTEPAMHPLPAVGVLPAMMIFGTKENKKFKPYKPYGKNTRTSI
jgi:hypothetical protein